MSYLYDDYSTAIGKIFTMRQTGKINVVKEAVN